ncbi:MAG: DUF1877 family protein [Streptosporangiaceae bacterium]
MSYPVTHLALTAEDAGLLRRWHASGEDAAVLARVRELAASSVARVSTDQAWEPIRRCLAGFHPISNGEPVFSRRDYIIELLDPAAVAAAASALAEVSREWLRERLENRSPRPNPGPAEPGPSADFGTVWESLARLAGFFARASRGQQYVLFFTASRYWRPPRREPGPDGRTRVVRPAYRPQDYTVDPNSLRSLPAGGGSWPFEAELAERDGVLYSWTEVGRFIRGGRTWVRLTISDSEYYIDVENADDRIGRIECVDPLVAYWLARRTDDYPVVLED